MIRLGVLTENDCVVLIRGEIVSKMSIGPKHGGCVKKLIQLLVPRAGGAAIIASQDPLRLPDSEPEPDVSVLRRRADFYTASQPVPADVFLIIEVADSSLDDDRNLRRSIYAESGIPEYWIVNLVDECLDAYGGSGTDGTYSDTRVLKRGESTDVAALPSRVVAVDEVL